MDYTVRVLNYYTAAMMLLHLMACLSERSYREKRIRLFINMMILDIVILLSEAFVSKLLEDYQADGLLWAKLVSCVLHISSPGFTPARS